MQRWHGQNNWFPTFRKLQMVTIATNQAAFIHNSGTLLQCFPRWKTMFWRKTGQVWTTRCLLCFWHWQKATSPQISLHPSSMTQHSSAIPRFLLRTCQLLLGQHCSHSSKVRIICIFVKTCSFLHIELPLLPANFFACPVYASRALTFHSLWTLTCTQATYLLLSLMRYNTHKSQHTRITPLISSSVLDSWTPFLSSTPTIVHVHLFHAGCSKCSPSSFSTFWFFSSISQRFFEQWYRSHKAWTSNIQDSDFKQLSLQCTMELHSQRFHISK